MIAKFEYQPELRAETEKDRRTFGHVGRTGYHSRQSPTRVNGTGVSSSSIAQESGDDFVSERHDRTLWTYSSRAWQKAAVT